jgi:hypothetical protein
VLNALVYPTLPAPVRSAADFITSSLTPKAEPLYDRERVRLFDANNPLIRPVYHADVRELLDQAVVAPWVVAVPDGDLLTTYLRPGSGNLLNATGHEYDRDAFSVDPAFRTTDLLLKLSAVVDGVDVVEYHNAGVEVYMGILATTRASTSVKSGVRTWP